MTPTPRTEAGRVIDTVANSWHGANCDMNFLFGGACSCELRQWLVKVEAEARQQAIDAAVKAVEGLPCKGRFGRKPDPRVADCDAIGEHLVEYRAVLEALRGLR